MPEFPTEPTLVERLRGAAARQLARLPGPVQLALSHRPRTVVDGQTFDPMLQLLVSLRPPRTALMSGSARESRARFRRELLSVRDPLTPVGAVRNLFIEGGEGMLAARHYAPESPDGAPLVVFYHGGGFVLGDLDTHDEACRMLCKHAAQHVLSVDYRLAPEHPFPAPIEDAMAAFRWAAEHAAELGADARRVAVGGDSAGGTLAAVIAQRAAQDPVPPVAQLLIYPATDRNTPRASHRLFDVDYFLTMADRDGFYRCYLDGTGADPDHPFVSPLREPNLGGLPPALVVVAGFDVLRDEGEAYAAALQAAGTPVVVQREPALGHGFVNLTNVSTASRRATIDMARRWKELVAGL